jgi:hypothetical protein
MKVIKFLAQLPLNSKNKNKQTKKQLKIEKENPFAITSLFLAL